MMIMIMIMARLWRHVAVAVALDSCSSWCTRYCYVLDRPLLDEDVHSTNLSTARRICRGEDMILCCIGSFRSRMKKSNPFKQGS